MAGASLLTLLDDIAMLLDDIAILSKVAAKKTAGVLGDDLAVNAEQLSGKGISADRELPIVWAVFKGSLLNKAIIVPIALLLSFFLPALIMPLLMIGGAFLCYEGAEKLWHWYAHKDQIDESRKERLKAIQDPEIDINEFEKDKIKGAIKMDFILSAEIVVIALGTMSDKAISMQIIALSIIAIIMTVGVYGFVALIVKIDDLGLYLAKDKREGRIVGFKRSLGNVLVGFAPKLMKFLTIAGTIAMFLVGGSLVVHGIPYLHHLVETVNSFASNFPSMESTIVFIGPMLIDLIVGLILGAILVTTHTGIDKLRSSNVSECN